VIAGKFGNENLIHHLDGAKKKREKFDRTHKCHMVYESLVDWGTRQTG
jgi:hypothetical protein